MEENTKAIATDDDMPPTTLPTLLRDNVGGVVMATDPDPNADPLTYTLERDR